MISVRPAEQRDADVAIDVVRRSIAQLCIADHHNDEETLTTWLANKTPQNFLSWLSNVDNFCVVVESDGRLVGVGVLHRRGEILLFYLAPGAQRQGIGKKNSCRPWGKGRSMGADVAALGQHGFGLPLL
jgi:ribosomal protein S18 acetylase RimI-like enzyme